MISFVFSAILANLYNALTRCLVNRMKEYFSSLLALALACLDCIVL